MRDGYFGNLAGWLTQSLNTLLGGDRDQTFSSRCFEAMLTGRPWGRAAVAFIDFVFLPFGGEGHCARAYASDTERTYT